MKKIRTKNSGATEKGENEYPRPLLESGPKSNSATPPEYENYPSTNPIQSDLKNLSPIMVQKKKKKTLRISFSLPPNPTPNGMLSKSRSELRRKAL
jgi:hypothetical protein